MWSFIQAKYQCSEGNSVASNYQPYSPSLWEMQRFHVAACLPMDLFLHRQSTHWQQDHSWSRTWSRWLHNNLLYRPLTIQPHDTDCYFGKLQYVTKPVLIIQQQYSWLQSTMTRKKYKDNIKQQKKFQNQSTWEYQLHFYLATHKQDSYPIPKQWKRNEIQQMKNNISDP